MLELQLDRKLGDRGVDQVGSQAEQLVEVPEVGTEEGTAEEEVQLEPAPPVSLQRSKRDVVCPVRYTE